MDKHKGDTFILDRYRVVEVDGKTDIYTNRNCGGEMNRNIKERKKFSI